MTKKVPTKKAKVKIVPKTKSVKKSIPVKKLSASSLTIESLVELIRITSTVVPDDVYRCIAKAIGAE
jgi:hypothetical protein